MCYAGWQPYACSTSRLTYSLWHSLTSRHSLLASPVTSPYCLMKDGFAESCILYRVAALYLVERIKNEVVSIAATHFQALAVGQARQRAIRRLAHNPPGFSKSISVCPVLNSCYYTCNSVQASRGLHLMQVSPASAICTHSASSITVH